MAPRMPASPPPYTPVVLNTVLLRGPEGAAPAWLPGLCGKVAEGTAESRSTSAGSSPVGSEDGAWAAPAAPALPPRSLLQGPRAGPQAYVAAPPGLEREVLGHAGFAGAAGGAAAPPGLERAALELEALALQDSPRGYGRLAVAVGLAALWDEEEDGEDDDERRSAARAAPAAAPAPAAAKALCGKPPPPAPRCAPPAGPAPQALRPCAATRRLLEGPPALPALGSPELPSAGSAAHGGGLCRPCAFVRTKGCANGLACVFCHLCDADAAKRLRRERRARRGAAPSPKDAPR